MLNIVNSNSMNKRLFRAVMNNDFKYTKYLLEHMHVQVLTTPLHIAVKNNNIDIVSLLINHNKKHTYDKDGNSPLHLAVKNNNNDITKLLLYYTEWPMNVNKEGDTPLMIACRGNNKQIIYDILDNINHKDKYYVNRKNKKGESALSICNDSDIRLLLLMYGARE